MHKEKKAFQAEDVPVEVVEPACEGDVCADAVVIEADAVDEASEAPVATDDAAEQAQTDVSACAAGEVCTQFEDACGQVNIDDESTLSIDGGVVEKIVAMTCREVDGVLQLKGNLINSIPGLRGSDATKGVSVEMSGDDACTVSVAVILEYGKSAPRVFQELHDKVAGAIESMTGLKVNAVNVRVTNVLTRAEAEGGKRKEKTDA